MYSRVKMLEIDMMRADVPDAVSRFEEHAMPRLREQEGFEGAVVLANAEGKGMVVTLWSSQEALEASTGLAAALVEEFVTVYAAPPGRESYEVLYADVPDVVVSTR